MTSRIPPSRRSPEYAPQRAAKVVQQQTPGAGRVPGVAQPGVSQAVAAALRGKPSTVATAPSGGGGTTFTGLYLVSSQPGGNNIAQLYVPAADAPILPMEVFAAAAPLTTGQEIRLGAYSTAGDTFSFAALTLVKIADASGAPITGGAVATIDQSGTGLTTVDFGASSLAGVSANYSLNGSEDGFTVASDGWYYAAGSITFEA